MKEGDLKSLKNDQNSISFETKVNVIYQILEAISIIHDNEIIHCDIKPDNIFIKSKQQNDIQIILGDFDICSDLEKKTQSSILKSTLTSRKGTPNFMAPEVDSGEQKVSYQSDMWSFGVTMKLILGDEQMKSKDAFDLFSKCCETDQSKRISAKEALKHSLFKDMKQ